MLLLYSVLVLLYIVWVWVTNDVKNDGKEWGPDWLARAIGRVVAAILNFEGVTSSIIFDAEPLGPCIGAGSPHGAFPVTQIGFALFAFRCDDTFRRYKIRSAGASILFYWPGIRELLLLLGVRDASRANLERLLAGGYSVTLVPGGIWEMVNTRADQEQVFLMRRLGFLRLAMRHGVPVVPIYTFGENQLFTVHQPLRVRLPGARTLGAKGVGGALPWPLLADLRARRRHRACGCGSRASCASGCRS